MGSLNFQLQSTVAVPVCSYGWWVVVGQSIRQGAVGQKHARPTIRSVSGGDRCGVGWVQGFGRRGQQGHVRQVKARTGRAQSDSEQQRPRSCRRLRIAQTGGRFGSRAWDRLEGPNRSNRPLMDPPMAIGGLMDESIDRPSKQFDRFCLGLRERSKPAGTLSGGGCWPSCPTTILCLGGIGRFISLASCIDPHRCIIHSGQDCCIFECLDDVLA